jgi:hypothetical protein
LQSFTEVSEEPGASSFRIVQEKYVVWEDHWHSILKQARKAESNIERKKEVKNIMQPVLPSILFFLD